MPRELLRCRHSSMRCARSHGTAPAAQLPHVTRPWITGVSWRRISDPVGLWTPAAWGCGNLPLRAQGSLHITRCVQMWVGTRARVTVATNLAKDAALGLAWNIGTRIWASGVSARASCRQRATREWCVTHVHRHPDARYRGVSTGVTGIVALRQWYQGNVSAWHTGTRSEVRPALVPAGQEDVP